MDKLKEIMMKKKGEGKELTPVHATAKMGVLQNLLADMDKLGAEKLGGLKKVTVASDSKQGLEKGLEKASEIVQKGPLSARNHDGIADSGNAVDQSDEDEYTPEHNPEEDEAHEAMESPELEADEHAAHGDESPEALEAKIAELTAKLKELKKV